MHIVQCGYPRSGSTMLYNMLRSTVEGYQFYDKETPASWVINDPGDKITKDPKDVFYMREIQEVLGDDVRFLVSVRDPRSVLCSKHVNTGDLYKVSWDFTWKRGPAKMVRKGRRKGLRRESPKHMGLIDWHKAIMGTPVSAMVKYEDVITSTEEVQTRLGRIFGFAYRAAFSDFHTSDIPPRLAHQLNGVRPVDSSRIESWHSHPERIKQQFTECPELFDILIQLGYEKNTEWFNQL